MALTLFRPLIGVAFILTFILLLWVARQSHLRWWPALVSRILVILLALMWIFSEQVTYRPKVLPNKQIMIVDQSFSLSQDSINRGRQLAEEWRSQGPNHLLIVFGESVQTLIPGSDWVEIDGRASDLVSALELAEKMVEGANGRVVLASDLIMPSSIDGSSEVSQIIHRLASEGHVTDIVPLSSMDLQKDISVDPLWAPSSLWRGTPFTAVTTVHSSENNDEVNVKWMVDGQIVSEERINIPVGDSALSFRFTAPDEDILTLGVSIDADGDPRPENNRSFASIQLLDAPNVLLVGASDEEALSSFQQLLLSTGISVDQVIPELLTTDLSTLNKYRVIFLDNFLASELQPNQILALNLYVKRLGGGLIFLGGLNSYTLGGYKDTMLEHMLPVKLEPPPRPSTTAFVVMIDSSDSMKGGSKEGSRIDLAKEGAMRAVEMMKFEDYAGVMNFSDSPQWAFPVQSIGSSVGLGEALDSIVKIQASGGTHMYQAMEEAINALIETNSEGGKFILLLTDGQSYDGDEESFINLAAKAKEQGISISTIGITDYANSDLLSKIAVSGKGHFYQTINANDLPRIMITESTASRSGNIQWGNNHLKLSEKNHPVLFGMSEASLPTLLGYNALSSKSELGAEDVLVSSAFDDPILSTWQYSLGRVTAWMGDLGQDWAQPWNSTLDEASFWMQVIRYTMAEPSENLAHVEIKPASDHLEIEASVLDRNGIPVNLIPVKFTYRLDSQDPLTLDLQQSSPGVYRISIPRPNEGAYRGILTYELEGQEITEIIPFSINYSEEFEKADLSKGLALRDAILKAGNGKLLSEDSEIFDLPETETVTTQNSELIDVNAVNWDYILFALAAFWVIDIALRRRWLPWK